MTKELRLFRLLLWAMAMLIIAGLFCERCCAAEIICPNCGSHLSVAVSISSALEPEFTPSPTTTPSAVASSTPSISRTPQWVRGVDAWWYWDGSRYTTSAPISRLANYVQPIYSQPVSYSPSYSFGDYSGGYSPFYSQGGFGSGLGGGWGMSGFFGGGGGCASGACGF